MRQREEDVCCSTLVRPVAGLETRKLSVPATRGLASLARAAGIRRSFSEATGPRLRQLSFSDLDVAVQGLECEFRPAAAHPNRRVSVRPVDVTSTAAFRRRP